ncbi:MAG: ribosome maturation factor RimP [Epulopiscium sp.]|nr:ribosome maturation factor RimP [Candidatus Epulonipiscium sp.]
MLSKKIEQQVEEMLYPILQEKNFECVDVEFVKEGPNWYLRIFIDKEGGITIDDCEWVSRSLEKELDKTDPIIQPYILEVSSPGLDRPLKKEEDFKRYQGELVDVKLYKAVNKQKEFQGKLIGLQDDQIVIEDEKGEICSFPRDQVSIVRLAVIW